MRYRDLAAAVEWLCIAFGFEKHRVVAGADGAVAVAQLSVGDNIIMLLPVGGSELDRVMKQPDEIGGAETQSCYLAVDDVDGHYAKAKAAGARFVLDLKEYDNGGRGFSCCDPEGHVWNFGTYDPYEGKAVSPPPPPAEKPVPRAKRRGAATILAMAAITVAVGMGGWVLATLQQTAPSVEVMRLKEEVAAAQQRAQQALDRAAQDAAELSRERAKRQLAERAAKLAREESARRETASAAETPAPQVDAQLAEERRAKEAAERAAKTAADQVARERTAKQAAQNATLVVQKELAAVRAAKEIAEQSAKAAADLLAREQAAREAAERAAKDAQAKLSQAQGEKGAPRSR
jgi:uncharacterized glyoxalase superfamily protein PhnB